jgi:glycosyltransferase involved in cell wall biosynthesis
MNILFLSRDYPPNQIGGVGTYTYEMAQFLSRMGHKVFVVTEAIDQPLEYVDQGVYVFRVKSKKNIFFNPVREKIKGFIERLEYSYAVSKKLREIVSKYKIDIIESCEARAEGFWYYLFKRKPALVIKLHTPEGIVYKLNREIQTKDRQLIERLEEWWIWRAQAVIGLSEGVVDLTRRYYRLPFKNLPIVPNPINIGFFKPDSYLNNSETVLYIGRLEFRKGIHILIRAVSYVLERIPQVKFIFIGDDCGMKPYLINKIAQLKIENSVEFLTRIPRDKLINYYQQSTLCVVPSLWENQPYVILEAMACGKPIIASNVGGISKIIKDKINGILVTPGSVLDLAKSIVKTLSDKELQKKIGSNARRYIEEKYVPIEVIKMTLEIYKKLLK